MSNVICPDCGDTNHYGAISPLCKARVEIGSPTRERMDIEYPDVHVKMDGKKIGTIVGKFIPEDSCECKRTMPMDGLALQSPTPEQIDHDIIGEQSLFRQKIADLETAKNFHMACIENLVERLNDVEGKLRSLESAINSIELSRLRGTG